MSGKELPAGEGAVFRADRTAILADRETADFVQQFAPVTPRRRAEFETRLAALIDSHCLKREQAVVDKRGVATARALGAKGGNRGGPRRAESLSPEQRKDIALKAANARWHGGRKQQSEAIELIQSFRAKRGKSPSRRAIAKHFKCSNSTATRYLKAALHSAGGRVDADD